MGWCNFPNYYPSKHFHQDFHECFHLEHLLSWCGLFQAHWDGDHPQHNLQSCMYRKKIIGNRQKNKCPRIVKSPLSRGSILRRHPAKLISYVSMTLINTSLVWNDLRINMKEQRKWIQYLVCLNHMIRSWCVITYHGRPLNIKQLCGFSSLHILPYVINIWFIIRRFFWDGMVILTRACLHKIIRTNITCGYLLLFRGIYYFDQKL